MTEPVLTPPRSRPDRCPGVLRPWAAEDGALARVRLVGGEITVDQLLGLADVAARYGDGRLHLTSRANLQLRALPTTSDGELEPDVVAALGATGLLPSHSHDLVRNVMVSPLTGLHGGRADLRPTARAYDDLLCADPALARLPGKFLAVLDDGRGDLVGHDLDLGAVAVDARHAQVRAGATGWGDVVPLDELAPRLVELARRFLELRGDGPAAAWHVDELDRPLLAASRRDTRTQVASGPLPFGDVGPGAHVEIPGGVLDRSTLDEVVALAQTERLVVTPWRGLVVPTR
ncbi:MAG TPA: nitrite reductase [Marmoricola sp.]|nr:nitrite reductase [Marmoricola sp.]